MARASHEALGLAVLLQAGRFAARHLYRTALRFFAPRPFAHLVGVTCDPDLIPAGEQLPDAIGAAFARLPRAASRRRRTRSALRA